jgi:tetratricopeptide (TPR) repeat protein
MTRRHAIAALPIACILFLGASLAPAAEEILKLVPDSASGFLLVNHPAAADAKIQALGREMQLPVPSLLAMLKQQFGIQDGLDENGTMGLIVLPPEIDGAIPTMILLMPVTDYGKFIEQLKPENAEEAVTKIEVMRTPAWARNIGGYAALTDISHKDVLEKTITLSREVPAGLAPWREWLAANDVAGVILQPGIKRVSARAQEAIRNMKPLLAQAGDQAKAAVAMFNIYASFFQAAEKEVSACGIGLQLDKQNAVRITNRTSLVSGGDWGQLLAQNHPAGENLLKGLPDEPFVAVGGGVVSEAMLDKLMKFSFNIMKSMPDLYGMSAEQVDKISETSVQALKGIRGASFMLGEGQSNEPIYSKFIGVMQVDNSQAFLANYEKYLRQYGKLIKDAHSPILQPPTIEKSVIGGVASLQITMNVPQPPGVAKMPQQARLMETLLGPGEKITTWLAPVDEHHIVMGYVSKKHIQDTLKALKQGKPGLANDEGVSKTAALLPPDAILVAYISPQGTIDFIKRMASVIIPPEMKVEQKIPDFPKTPPLGFALTTAPNELQTSLIVPAEVLLAVPQYIQKINSQQVTQAKTFNKEAEAQYKLGEESLKNEKLDEAITHFQQALRSEPDYTEAHNSMGVALFKKGRIPEAIEYYQQALRLKPDYPEAHNNLGSALVDVGRLQEAIEQFKQSLRLNPDFAEAYFNLALAYAKIGRSAEAITSAQKALELAKSQGKTAQAKQIEDWLKTNREVKPE